jgi:hypothetical protein
VVTLEAPKASPPSPTLEGEATLEALLPKLRRWLTAGTARTAVSAHLHPVIIVTKSINRSIEAAAVLHSRLLNMH